MNSVAKGLEVGTEISARLEKRQNVGAPECSEFYFFDCRDVCNVENRTAVDPADFFAVEKSGLG